MTLRQRNLTLRGVTLSDLPTGTGLSQALPVVTLVDDQRAPTSLTLGSDYILLDTGSKIITDSASLASVALRGKQNAPGSTNAYASATSALLLGQIVSHGGTGNLERISKIEQRAAGATPLQLGGRSARPQRQRHDCPHQGDKPLHAASSMAGPRLYQAAP